MEYAEINLINLFIIYHHINQAQFEDLRQQLEALDQRNEGYEIVKVGLHDQQVTIDGDDRELREYLDAADIILVLMSDRLILSSYFHSPAVRDTLRLHEQERSFVVPIILQTCWWEDTIFSDLRVLPKAGLPIYDSTDGRSQLFDQLIEELDQFIMEVKRRKNENKQLFQQSWQEAERLFKDWESDPGNLRFALPIYDECQRRWRRGFHPPIEVVEKRIAICKREIQFSHYARAARAAQKNGQLQRAFFNCQDALELRQDADIEGLYLHLQEKMQERKLQEQHQPFEAHIQTADHCFQRLQWSDAAAEYKAALEFYDEQFEPTRKQIDRKIEICLREDELEKAREAARKYQDQQDYQSSINRLMAAIEHIHKPAFDSIKHALKLLDDLDYAEPFFDENSRRWGFYHTKSELLIVPAKFRAAYNFHEGLAAVKKEERWGYIDIEGNIIIPFDYDVAGRFQNGQADVVRKGKSFKINRKGEPLD